MIFLTLAAGLLLLCAGGDLLVRGCVGTARRLGVSPLLTGVILVGFGTSTPELVTSIEAALLGSPGIAIGNVVGSNTANILLILGLAALVAPIACAQPGLARDAAMMAAAALAALALTLLGEIERAPAVILLVVLAAYVALSLRAEKRRGAAPNDEAAATADDAKAPLPLALYLTLATTGIAMTIFGADLLVKSALALSRSAGLSETVIGVTIVAVGTSLPELSASIIAVLKRQGEVALGNVLGSNVYNVLGILGVTPLIAPLPVPAEIARLDIWVMLGATLLLLVMMITGRRLSRAEGAVLLLAYAGYIGVLYAGA